MVVHQGNKCGSFPSFSVLWKIWLADYFYSEMFETCLALKYFRRLIFDLFFQLFNDHLPTNYVLFFELVFPPQTRTLPASLKFLNLFTHINMYDQCK